MPRFRVGHQFTTRGKAPRTCTVIDILKTYDLKGNLVQVRYVATHEFMGQTLTDSNVCDATIAMGSAQ
jgi:hypothetical protein